MVSTQAAVALATIGVYILVILHLDIRDGESGSSKLRIGWRRIEGSASRR